jgi:hypothetical protein
MDLNQTGDRIPTEASQANHPIGALRGVRTRRARRDDLRRCRRGTCSCAEGELTIHARQLIQGLCPSPSSEPSPFVQQPVRDVIAS